MKASVRWLRELVPGLSTSEAAVEEIARRLTHAGIEVEAIEEFGAGTKTLLVAEVVSFEPHPTRPKLRLVTVKLGDDKTQKVVCGAPNVPDPGGLVAFAPLGAHLPAVGMTLTPRDIGGIVSEGMLCSERELGLNAIASKDEDHGIMILKPGLAKPGTPFREAMPEVHDHILHLGLTPNRPDCLGHIGLAREVATLFGLDFQLPAVHPAKLLADESVEQHVSVAIDDLERCPRYGAGMVVDVTVGPSPSWMKYRLESLGIRSISNLVDVTNLILLEYGQPMHAFDLDDVRGSKIIVRRAQPGEKLKTLDGVDRALEADDLVIADGEGPTALAGIMGGANSEIRSTTRRVLLECAYFMPRGVRRAARRHGMHTESSHRFERGVNHGTLEAALARATTLLADLSGGKALTRPLFAGAPIPAREPVRFRASRMRSLLGVAVPMPEATDILKRLGFGVLETHGEDDGAYALVIPPPHRPDIQGEADLIEEVVRVRGLGTVPTVLPALRPQEPRTAFDLQNRVRAAAVALGLSEAITYGFVSPNELEALGLPLAPFKLINPLVEQRSVMRTSLLPGLLEALARSRRHGVHDVRLFTSGARFLASEKTAPLADEVPSFAAILAGSRHVVLQKPVEVDVYDAKGIAVEIVERATQRKATVAHQPEDKRAPYLHPRAAGMILVEGRVVGGFGPLHPDVVDNLDLGGGCVVMELDLRALAEVGRLRPQYKPIPVLPAATRDIALVVADEVEAGTVGASIRETAGDLCESVELFDLFRGQGIPAGHRSLAFHVIYRDPKAATDPEKAKTLTDEEVDRRHKSVIEAAHAKFGATLRA